MHLPRFPPNSPPKAISLTLVSCFVLFMVFIVYYYYYYYYYIYILSLNPLQILFTQVRQFNFKFYIKTFKQSHNVCGWLSSSSSISFVLTSIVANWSVCLKLSIRFDCLIFDLVHSFSSLSISVFHISSVCLFTLHMTPNLNLNLFAMFRVKQRRKTFCTPP